MMSLYLLAYAHAYEFGGVSSISDGGHRAIADHEWCFRRRFEDADWEQMSTRYTCQPQNLTLYLQPQRLSYKMLRDLTSR